MGTTSYAAILSNKPLKRALFKDTTAAQNRRTASLKFFTGQVR